MEFFSLSSILLLLFLTSPIHSLTDQPFISSLNLREDESCPYTVIVTTSCFSPDFSRDQITIALGDANGNQVVAAKLNEPLSRGGGFEKCSSDTFQVKGECLNIICSLYMYRTGPDGWIPDTIEIYKEGSKSVKFNFNQNVPENIWSGNNNCNNTDLPPPSPEFPPFSPTDPPPSPDFPPFSPTDPPPSPDFPPFSPTDPPPSPDFPPFPPTVPPPSPPYFPPEPPSIPPPPPPRPSAASGRGFGESLVVASAAIVFAFAAVVA